MLNLFSLRDKKAIVTGGARGLGKVMANALSEAGAKIAIIDILSVDKVIKNGKKDVFFIKADLTDRKERHKAFNAAISKLGTLDILVNNAGIQLREKAENFKIEDWDKIIELNLTAVFELCQLSAKIMLKKGHGKIINLASMLSFFGGITVPAYAASKGGITQLTKALSNEWSQKGINVNAIAPGFMRTELNSEIIKNKVRYNRIKNRIPAGRWGIPEDLKGAIIFLASPASDYINGIILPVDGGFLGR